MDTDVAAAADETIGATLFGVVAVEIAGAFDALAGVGVADARGARLVGTHRTRTLVTAMLGAIAAGALGAHQTAERFAARAVTTVLRAWAGLGLAAGLSRVDQTFA